MFSISDSRAATYPVNDVISYVASLISFDA